MNLRNITIYTNIIFNLLLLTRGFKPFNNFFKFIYTILYLKNKKIIYLNLFFVISLYVISFFLRPNLIIQNKYSYINIPINPETLVAKFILDKKDVEEIEIGTLINSFMGSLINKKPLSIIDNCPKKITYENFRDIIFYKLNENNFSIDIINNSPKESIQKCFETIFIEEFNKFYLNEIKKKIKIYSDINNINQQYLNTFNNKNDNSKIIYEYNYNIQTRTLAINFLKNFNFIVDPNIKYQPTIKKNEISYVLIYLVLVLIFFSFQIIYFVIKELYKYKKINIFKL